VKEKIKRGGTCRGEGWETPFLSTAEPPPCITHLTRPPPLPVSPFAFVLFWSFLPGVPGGMGFLGGLAGGWVVGVCPPLVASEGFFECLGPSRGSYFGGYRVSFGFICLFLLLCTPILDPPSFWSTLSCTCCLVVCSSGLWWSTRSSFLWLSYDAYIIYCSVTTLTVPKAPLHCILFLVIFFYSYLVLFILCRLFVAS
jgi:hypothetical protein